MQFYCNPRLRQSLKQILSVIQPLNQNTCKIEIYVDFCIFSISLLVTYLHISNEDVIGCERHLSFARHLLNELSHHPTWLFHCKVQVLQYTFYWPGYGIIHQPGSKPFNVSTYGISLHDCQKQWLAMRHD